MAGPPGPPVWPGTEHQASPSHKGPKMWSLPLSSQSPPQLSLKGDTQPALEDRGPSWSKEKPDTSGCKGDAVAVSQLTTQAEQRRQESIAHCRRVVPPQETGCSGTLPPTLKIRARQPTSASPPQQAAWARGKSWVRL